MGEAVQAVPVFEDRFALHLIEDLADLRWRHLPMVEEGDEFGYGALKVDVVLAECIVKVNEQGLVGQGHAGQEGFLIIAETV
jgi:hypothetical protein